MHIVDGITALQLPCLNSFCFGCYIQSLILNYMNHDYGRKKTICIVLIEISVKQGECFSASAVCLSSYCLLNRNTALLHSAISILIIHQFSIFYTKTMPNSSQLTRSAHCTNTFLFLVCDYYSLHILSYFICTRTCLKLEKLHFVTLYTCVITIKVPLNY